MNIIQAIEDPRLFKPFFKDLGTWRSWLTYLRALFALGVEGGVDLELFRLATGLDAQPARVRESFVICGRRSGKSFISAVIAVYLACFKDWLPFLSPGEQGYIFIIAVDKKQAGIIKAYISGLLHGNKILEGMVDRETREGIVLRNRVTLAVKTSSFRSVRGYTLLCAILEELAFWRSEESANPDKEILAAVRPALATIPDSLLIGISTPYSRAGVLWELYKQNWGKAEGPLIWRAATHTMNPTIPRETIDQAFREDPEAAAAEWAAEFRSDITAFIPSELIEGVTVPGRYELPKVEGVQYFGFTDPSGGRQDSFTLAVSHRSAEGRAVLDVLRERKSPFNPESVTIEFSDILKTYGLAKVRGDRFSGEWVSESFRKSGILYEASEKTASELYLEILPMLASGAVELLDHRRLRTQFANLERRTRAGGKDLITHYAGGHDDCANAAAGVLVMAQGKVRRPGRVSFGGEIVSGPQRKPEEVRHVGPYTGPRRGRAFVPGPTQKVLDRDEMIRRTLAGWRRPSEDDDD